jgi:hypothetical protein
MGLEEKRGWKIEDGGWKNQKTRVLSILDPPSSILAFSFSPPHPRQDTLGEIQ